MKKGFTLVETVVLVGVSTVALMALVNLFLIFNSIYGYERAYIAVAGSAGASINALEASVLPADKVLSSVVISGTTYTSASTTLVLELPSVNSAGSIITSAFDYVVFYRAQASLYRLVKAAPNSVRVNGTTTLSTSVTSLTFTYDNTDVTKATNVIADIVTSKTYKQQTIQDHLKEQMYLRNK